ncbi:MAG: hypothetical protein IJ109_08090 [Firmicutes bacterium]|nr:hypothetical protein [Bacillota bacterium]
MWEKNHYKLSFSKNPFYRHEQVVLSTGACPGFFPVSFLRHGEGLDAAYECSGYAPLHSFRIERTEDALFLMEETLRILHRAPEYLLAPERAIIRTETVFYDKDSGRLQIAFLPLASGSSSLIQNLLLFLAQLKQDLRDGHTGIIDQFASDMYYNCLSTGDMLRVIGAARRQLEELTQPGSQTSGVS